MEQPPYVPIQKEVHRQIGSYTLLAQIATGGMATVFLARKEGPGGFEKLVVIKQILPHLIHETKFVNMFLDEARIAARLDHPNIVQIYDLGKSGDEYYLAMEYLPGASFAELILNCSQRNQHLHPGFCLELISQACEGLEFAHTARSIDGQPLGIVHRDINHRNLMVTFSGVVKVVDFGIAKAKGALNQTQTGTLKGTFPYMSPEQCRGLVIDQRSDIFSLGIVFYELLSRKRLFKRRNELATLKAVTEEPIPPVTLFREELDPAVVQILKRSLAREREDRYASAREMQRDIKDAMPRCGKLFGMQDLAEYMQSHLTKQVERHQQILSQIRSHPSGLSLISLPTGETEADIPGSDPDLDEDPEIVTYAAQARQSTNTEFVQKPKQTSGGRRLWYGIGLGVVFVGAAALVWWLLGRGQEDHAPKSNLVAVVGKSALGGLRIETQPAGAKIAINGALHAQVTPVIIQDLDPNMPIRLRVELDGYQPIEQQPIIGAGNMTSVSLILTQLPGQVEIRGLPAQTLVKLDGKLVGTTEARQPFWATLAPGVEHELQVEQPGFVTQTQKVIVKSGEKKSMVIEVKKSQIFYGTLEVNCVPWCSISVDGRDLKLNSPAKDIRLAVGSHRLKVINPPTGAIKEVPFVIQKNQNTRLVVRLP